MEGEMSHRRESRGQSDADERNWRREVEAATASFYKSGGKWEEERRCVEVEIQMVIKRLTASTV